MENSDKDQNVTKNHDETIFFSPSKSMNESQIVECEKKDISTQCEIDEKENKKLPVTEIEKIRNLFLSEMNEGNLQYIREDTTLSRHLSNISVALSDVSQKYDRTKLLIEESNANIKILKEKLSKTNERIAVSKQYCDDSRKMLLENHDKFNKDYVSDQETAENKRNALMKTMRVLEIKIKSLQSTIDQVTAESNDLRNLLNTEK